MNSAYALFENAQNALLDRITYLRSLPMEELRKPPRASRHFRRLCDHIVKYLHALYRLRPEAREYVQQAASTNALLQVIWSLSEIEQPKGEPSAEALFAFHLLWKHPEVELGARVEDVRDAMFHLDQWRFSDSREPEPAEHVQKSKRKAGRRRDPEKAKQRKLVCERWNRFRRDYRRLGYSKATYKNFAEWADEIFDDMPSVNPDEIRRMVNTYRKNGISSSDYPDE